MTRLGHILDQLIATSNTFFIPSNNLLPLPAPGLNIITSTLLKVQSFPVFIELIVYVLSTCGTWCRHCGDWSLRADCQNLPLDEWPIDAHFSYICSKVSHQLELESDLIDQQMTSVRPRENPVFDEDDISGRQQMSTMMIVIGTVIGPKPGMIQYLLWSTWCLAGPTWYW